MPFITHKDVVALQYGFKQKTTKIYTIHINKHVLKDQIISKLYVQIHNFTLFQNIILTMT